MSLLESAALGLRLANVVLLHCHRIGHLALQHSLQRRLQIAYSGSSWIVRVIRKDFEDSAAQDFLALSHRGAEIGIAGSDDGEVGRQNEVQTWNGLKKRPKVWSRRTGFRQAIAPNDSCTRLL